MELTEEMRERMLEKCKKDLAVWFSFKVGDDPVKRYNRIKVQQERIQFSIRVLLLHLIPKMTVRFHNLSEFKEELPLFMSFAPGIVSDVLTGHCDYRYGYHSVDVPFVFDWRINGTH